MNSAGDELEAEPHAEFNAFVLSIVIVSYENLVILTECLDSIYRYNDLGSALQVIVVEQSSSDEIFDRLTEDYPQVVAIRRENRGFGAGNNAGVCFARSPYLLFLNPDTILVEPVFAYAVEKFESHRELGLFGMRLISPTGRRNQSFYFRDPTPLCYGALWRVCDRIGLYIPRLMYITGADLFVRASAFRKVGGFNESIFLYFEESLLCHQIEKEHFKIRFFPEKKIIHLEGQSTPSATAFRYMIQSYQIQRRILGKDPIPGLLRWRRKLRIQSLLSRHSEALSARLEIIDSVLSNSDASNR